MKEIRRYKNRYVVEVADRKDYGVADYVRGSWGFYKAFDNLEDAEKCAKSQARYSEWVRVIETEGAYS